jgi:hypothetical protein
VGRSTRVASALVLAGLLAFVLLTALSAAAYPGGTFCDPNASGYRFWDNFFCDLTQPVTQRGLDNSRSRALAQASFVCFSLALGPFFWVLGGMLAARLGGWIRICGLTSALGTNVIAWLPSAVSPVFHQMSVFTAAIPGLLASVLGVWGSLKPRTSRPEVGPLRLSGGLGAAALGFGVLDASYYAYAIFVPGCYAWLPVLQKIAALCLMAWMVSVARLGLR